MISSGNKHQCNQIWRKWEKITMCLFVKPYSFIIDSLLHFICPWFNHMLSICYLESSLRIVASTPSKCNFCLNSRNSDLVLDIDPSMIPQVFHNQKPISSRDFLLGVSRSGKKWKKHGSSRPYGGYPVRAQELFKMRIFDNTLT